MGVAIIDPKSIAHGVGLSVRANVKILINDDWNIIQNLKSKIR